MPGDHDPHQPICETHELAKGPRPPGSGGEGRPECVPARMLNEFCYCPRLAYLEWVQSEFATNAYVEDGRFAHRRIDKPSGPSLAPCPEQQEDDAPVAVRSMTLSAPGVGLVAKMDLVEFDDGEHSRRAIPIDYKRGKQPDIPEGAWEPERVQLCAQGLILREHGFEVPHGIIYFVASRQRVQIDFDRTLKERTLKQLSAMRAMADTGVIPEPLDDSPKCPHCSLVGICLPDETNYLRTKLEEDGEPGTEPRRLIPARDDALPVYVQKQGGFVGKSGERLVVKFNGQKLAESRLFETSQLNLMGRVQVSTDVIRELCTRNIPIAYFSMGGWFYGFVQGLPHKNVELRQAQYRTADDPTRSLTLARSFVATKILNCRILLRRNAEESPDEALKELKRLANLASSGATTETLLGIEGAAAKVYFQAFTSMLKGEPSDGIPSFSLEGRNRRPPRDPVNALLSFAYAMLTKEMTVTLAGVGLDPFLGFFHRPRYGRPSLALDVIEEFRPLLADSTVITAINKGVVSPRDFIYSGHGVALKDGAKKAFIQAYEKRLDQLVRHPLFGYQVSYRRVLNIQARLLSRYLTGEVDAYPGFTTR